MTIRRVGTTLSMIVLLTLLWGGKLLTVLPLPESLQVALGFMLFVLPGGAFAYLVTGGKRWSWTRFMGFGLPIAVTFVGLMGLIARTFELNINHIAFVWYILSVITVTGALWRVQLPTLKPAQPSITHRTTLIFASVAILVVMMFTLVASYTMIKRNDILLHNAEITRHASGVALDWNEIYFDTGNRISDRISVAYWRFGESLMVYVTGVHILTAQLTISAMLMIYLGCAIYTSARLFNYSVQTSLLITILHFALLGLLTATDRQSGSEVFRRLIQDKVLAGFGFAPVIFGLTNQTLQTPSRRNFLLLGALVAGAIFTHPILSGFMVAVVGLWMVLNTVTTRRLRPYFEVALLCALIFSPIIIMRFTTEMNFNFGDDVIVAEDRLRAWFSSDDSLYAALPAHVGLLTYGLLAIAGLASLMRLNKSHQDRFHTAYIIIVSIGLVPFTAWIYGRLVSIPHIYRVIWIIPYGLLGFYVWHLLMPPIKARLSASYQLIGERIALLTVMVGAPLAVALGIFIQLDNLSTTLDLLDFQRELIDVADYIESQTDERVVVMGDSNQRFRDYLGTMSHLIKPVSFCEVRCLVNFTDISPEEADQRFKDNGYFFTERQDNPTRMTNLERYDVDYIIYQTDISGALMDDFFADYEGQFETVFQTQSVTVVKYLPATDN